MNNFSSQRLLLSTGHFPKGVNGCGAEKGLSIKTPAACPADLGKKTAAGPYTILVAGGITGGHLFPGIAIAEAFRCIDAGNRIIFVSVGNAFERKVLPQTGFESRWIRIEGFKGRGFLQKIKALLKIPGSILESAGIIRESKPQLVIGMGGFSSGPVVAAARLMGVRVVLHEQNMMPGITNRILARFAQRIYVSFPDTRLKAKSTRIRLTGNPVRRDILEEGEVAQPIEESAILEKERRFTVLVLGGSQGAHSINMAMIEALGLLRKPQKYYFIHQTGEADETLVKGTYLRHGLAADVQAFFHQMAAQYRKADLILCRAGATTIAEITAVGKPAVFIPYPYAADNHQVHNARALAGENAADIVFENELCGPKLAERIETYAADSERLAGMAARSKKMGRPQAALDIVADCYEMLTAAE